MCKNQHYILLFKSWKFLPWTKYFRFQKYWKGLQSWPRVSADDVTNLLLLRSSPLIKSSTLLFLVCYCSPWKLFTSLTFVLICEMWTFVLIFKVRCCSSVHLISVKGPLLCPVLFPLCSVCSVHPQPSFYSAFDSPTPRCRNGSLLPVCQALSL